MVEEDSIETNEENQTNEQVFIDPHENSSSSSSDESYSDSDDSEDEVYIRNYPQGKEDEDGDSPEANLKQFTQLLESKIIKKREEEEDKRYVYDEDLFDFPKDPEKWTEQDVQELWADAPIYSTKPGWDPVWADEDDWDIVTDEIEEGNDPAIAPFYLPYRKYYPVIPDNHYDISNPKSVIEELDRIEEFLKWVSYIFPDGSTYEGTVWDDLAHGKGVYVAEYGLVRYEGEWLQNNMEGHGVVEVDIPDVEPLPGSSLEAKMRAEGRIIKRDFMSPKDREWLEMDMEDSYELADGLREIPFYEDDEWISAFGMKPERGRYRYAGQWKHGRMHGCGVYEVNERPIFGRFYFGEMVDEDFAQCDEDTSTLHAGIAEVAAAKARMFVNKPDGMVREQRGPYSDPQHPYLYEEDDVWMAPGFINQFYEVPDVWKMYVHEVDEEREMWLNSFYKAPLRIPMPAELEYWWSQDHRPEFVILKKEPEPDPEDPSKLVYTEDPLILHTKTGKIINFVEDEKYGIRLFWQPPLKEGEEVDPKKIEFLPLGFDEFYGLTDGSEKKGGILNRLITKVEKVINPIFEKLEKWSEEKKKASDLKLQLIEKELEFIEAELCLEEALEDMESELEMKLKEEEKKEVEKEQLDKEDTSYIPADQDGTDSADEEEEDDDGAPTSFGSVVADQDLTKNDKGNKSKKSPFATTSFSFASSSIVSTGPSRLQETFQSWKNGKRTAPRIFPPCPSITTGTLEPSNSVSFFQQPAKHRRLKAAGPKQLTHHKTSVKLSQLHTLSQILSTQDFSVGKRHQCKQKPCRRHQTQEKYCLSVLSMHVPIHCLVNTVMD